MFGKSRSLMVGRFTSVLLFLFLLPLLVSASFSADATSFDPTKVAVTAKGSSGVPVGTIISWPVQQNPADFQNVDGTYNWLECNGQSVDQTVYTELFAVVGPTVPDLRGLFLRGYGSQAYAQNNGSTVGITSTLYESGQLGQVQGDAARQLSGTFGYDAQMGRFTPTDPGLFYNARVAMNGSSGVASYYGTYAMGFDSARVSPTAPENRPVNQAVRYLVRALP